MKGEQKESFPFGEFLKRLRERKGVSLKKVEEDTGISNAYLSQLETGERRRLPTLERLRLIADYYNVSIKQLLEKAGYLEEFEIEETDEQKIEKAFRHVINDPNFKYGSRLKKKYDLEAKRFIIEMYYKAFNSSIFRVDKKIDKEKLLKSSKSFTFEVPENLGEFKKIARKKKKTNQLNLNDIRKLDPKALYLLEIFIYLSPQKQDQLINFAHFLSEQKT